MKSQTEKLQELEDSIKTMKAKQREKNNYIAITIFVLGAMIFLSFIFLAMRDWRLQHNINEEYFGRMDLQKEMRDYGDIIANMKRIDRDYKDDCVEYETIGASTQLAFGDVWNYENFPDEAYDSLPEDADIRCNVIYGCANQRVDLEVNKRLEMNVEYPRNWKPICTDPYILESKCTNMGKEVYMEWNETHCTKTGLVKKELVYYGNGWSAVR